MQKSLLLIDDEMPTLKALARLFSHQGYEVAVANNAEQAWQHLDERAFPVVLSDYRMPGQTGDELLREIATRYPDTLGMLLSGYADYQIVLDALNSGVVHRFIEKPWDEKQLIKEVNDAFKQWRNAQIEKETSAIDACLSINASGVITAANHVAAEFFACPISELVGHNLTQVLPQLSRQNLTKLCLSDEVELELPTSHAPILVVSKPVALRCWQVIVKQPLLLTGKTRLFDEIQRYLTAGGEFSLLYSNIRQFSHINEHLGYQQADLLLERLERLLQKQTQPNWIFSRLEGAEFIWLVPGKLDKATAEKHLQQLLLPFGRAFEFAESQVLISARSGFVVSSPEITNVDTALKQARLSTTPCQGKNCHECIASKNLPANSVEQENNLQTDLCRALRDEEFVLYYQPKICAVSGRILGAEALIRWQHAEKGIIPPDQFIPLAEVNGLIEPIGRWVLAQALKQSQLWLQQGIPELSMSVNLSGRQLVEEDIAAKVAAILAQNNLAPQSLELEITETFLMKDLEHSTNVLNQIKALGVKIAIDDFGTGYSSLSYLVRLPADTLKIDRSFIREVDEMPKTATLVRNMVALSHDLGLRVVAEGVETQEQLDYLQKVQCDELQGYYFSPPVCADEFTQLLLKQVG